MTYPKLEGNIVRMSMSAQYFPCASGAQRTTMGYFIVQRSRRRQRRKQIGYTKYREIAHMVKLYLKGNNSKFTHYEITCLHAVMSLLEYKYREKVTTSTQSDRFLSPVRTDLLRQ